MGGQVGVAQVFPSLTRHTPMNNPGAAPQGCWQLGGTHACRQRACPRGAAHLRPSRNYGDLRASARPGCPPAQQRAAGASCPNAAHGACLGACGPHPVPLLLLPALLPTPYPRSSCAGEPPRAFWHSDHHRHEPSQVALMPVAAVLFPTVGQRRLSSKAEIQL